MSNGITNGTISRAFSLIAFFIAFCVGHSSSADVMHFARSPQFFDPSISPDGETLSYVQYSSGNETLVLRGLRDGRERRSLSLESRRERFGWCDWAARKFVLCGTVSPVRKPQRVMQRTRLYAIAVADGSTRELNRSLADPIRDHIIGFSAAAPNRALVQHDAKGSGYPEVSELNIETGQLTRIVMAHPPIRRWMTNYRGEVKLGIAYDAKRASFYVRDSEADKWTIFLEQEMLDTDAIAPLSIGPGTEVYALKHYRGRSALFSVDAKQREPTPKLLFADQRYDIVGPVVLGPTKGELLAVRYVQETQVQQPLHEQEARRQEWLDAQLPTTINIIVDRDETGRWLLVESGSDQDPPSLYLFDAQAQKLELIGHSYPELEGRPLPPMKSIQYRARDGQRIPGYLTVPLGERQETMPAVVLPHGGPEARTWKRFDPLVQFLAARGYAVLQMNFRGSLGYGAGFAAAGAGQWGGVIHNDITDGARWLLEQGIADPARMCIVGSSFGGYAALLGATRESQWYACAASFGGISDLLALSQHAQRLGDADIWRQRLGGDPRVLWQMSPIARLRSMETPVLLVHGLLDAIVPASQSRRFARALRKEGKVHELIMRTDCDHEMVIESCRVAYYQALQTFLDNQIALAR